MPTAFVKKPVVGIKMNNRQYLFGAYCLVKDCKVETEQVRMPDCREKRMLKLKHTGRQTEICQEDLRWKGSDFFRGKQDGNSADTQEACWNLRRSQELRMVRALWRGMRE